MSEYNEMQSLTLNGKKYDSFPDQKAREDIEKLRDSTQTAAQSDWSAAEGESGHILNRTHWAESTVGEAILEETTLTASEDDPGAFALEQAITMEVGATYAIIYNGTTYICTAVDASEYVEDASGLIFCGNVALMFEAGDTGEPFTLMCVSGELAMFWDADGAMSATAAIYSATETVHKLDDKYIDAEWLAKKVTVKGATVFEEQTLAFYTNSNSEMTFCTVFQDVPALTLGADYFVTFDGKEYLCVCQQFVGVDAYILGNLSLGSADYTDTGEPFYIVYIADGPTMDIAASDTSILEHTVAIQEATVTVVKMPEEYLPESVAKLPDGGTAGQVLALGEDGSLVWVDPGTNATYTNAEEATF